MNMTATCTCGLPLVGTVRQHREGAPWRESWEHENAVTVALTDPHSAIPEAGTVGPAPGITYPWIEVELIGQDGNAYNLIGLEAKAIKRKVWGNASDRFVTEATACGSYDELLALIRRTVVVR